MFHLLQRGYGLCSRDCLRNFFPFFYIEVWSGAGDDCQLSAHDFQTLGSQQPPAASCEQEFPQKSSKEEMLDVKL